MSKEAHKDQDNNSSSKNEDDEVDMKNKTSDTNKDRTNNNNGNDTSRSVLLHKSFSKSEEELENLKAKNIDDMILPFHDDDKQTYSRLLFMTNKQATAVSKHKKSIKLMIDTFCGENKPSLLIHLAQSWGFYNSTRLQNKETMEKGDWALGVREGAEKFRDEYRGKDMVRLVNFMVDVIIPLAEKTKAIILCSAVADDCILTETLINVMRMKTSRWPDGKPPFTIIRFMNQVKVLYMKDAKMIDKSNWKRIMLQNGNWKLRHEKILNEHFKQKFDKDPENELRRHDLDFSMGDLILVEGLDITIDDEFHCEDNQGPAFSLMSAIMNAYGKDIPTLVIKTGATPRTRKNFNPNAVDAMRLQYLVDRTSAKFHVLCLDMRQDMRQKDEIREIAVSEEDEGGNRASWTGQVTPFETTVVEHHTHEHEKNDGILQKKSQDELSDIVRNHLFPIGSIDSFDCCALARLHKKVQIVKNEMNKTEDEMKIPGALSESSNHTRNGRLQLSLEEQIHNKEIMYERGSGKSEIDYLQLSYLFMENFYEHLKKGSSEQFTQEITINAMYVQELLRSRYFHSLNIWNPMNKLKEYVDTHIILNCRRPAEVPNLEGLNILKVAWAYVDKTRVDANAYCKLSRWLIRIQLFLGLAITVLTMVGLISIKDDTRKFIKIATLVVSLLLSAFVSIESLLSPRTMWRQLRKASVELESIIWKYRACVGDFKVGLDTTRNAEDNLYKALEGWKEDLHLSLQNVAGTMIPKNINEDSSSSIVCFSWLSRLEQSDLTSAFKANKPTRDLEKASKSENNDENKDDSSKQNPDYDNHYSYIEPDEYIDFRLRKLKERYQKLLPNSVWSQKVWDIVAIALGVCIAFFSNVEFGWESETVLVLTALIALVKSWSEFSNLEDNYQLYPTAIKALRSKEAQWRKTTKYQQQNFERIEELVNSVEDIVINVIESWSSSLSQSKYKIPGAENLEKVSAYESGKIPSYSNTFTNPNAENNA